MTVAANQPFVRIGLSDTFISKGLA
jgi:hypothetical protein